MDPVDVPQEKPKAPGKGYLSLLASIIKRTDERREEETLDKERLIMLSDGIFAIAITLLVINIRLPDGLSEGAFNHLLGNQFLSQVIVYLVTFFVIAAYWGMHHRLARYITRIDNRFIQLTFLFLAFIAFFPVTSSLVGQGYAAYKGAIILYTLGFAGCGFSLLAIWLYASWRHRLIDQGIVPEDVATRSLNIALAPTYFSLSLLLLLTPLHPSDIFWSWILLPFLSLIIRRVGRSSLAQRLGEHLHAAPPTQQKEQPA